ncbi:carbohydrate sulfotransferase 14-like [Branchiostoma floridae]|uniref:Carbohydrate sulfotransferase n=1 Tax=Branchiostoma floridae TaxID=7739 RepID=A0A9J7LV05_BRAFL|nr:carbohydrate sulfotransferase 14-like [Branchiostoma floridae]
MFNCWKSQQQHKKTTCIFLLCMTTLIVLTYWVTGDLPNISNPRQYKTGENASQINFGYKTKKRGSGTHLLKQQCRNATQASKTDFAHVLRNLVVIDRYKVLYCRAGKTGSWTTLQLLYNLELETNMSRRDVRKLAEKKPLPVLSDFSQDGITHRLATYKKFLVARNPLERLASVWSGFFLTYPQFGWNERYQGMLRVICPENSTKNETCHEATEIKGNGNKTHRLVPFRAFIKALAENRTEFSNQHWRPINELCSPCQVSMDSKSIPLIQMYTDRDFILVDSTV